MLPQSKYLSDASVSDWLWKIINRKEQLSTKVKIKIFNKLCIGVTVVTEVFDIQQAPVLTLLVFCNALSTGW